MLRGLAAGGWLLYLEEEVVVFIRQDYKLLEAAGGVIGFDYMPAVNRTYPVSFLRP